MAPVDPRVETLALLRSIDASLKALVGRQASQPADAPGVDLDGPHGDPVVRAKDPRDWTGEPMKGRNFSQCPPDYLDLIAARFDYFAGRETDPKKAKYTRLDAARARGWAQRLRNGGGPPPRAEADAGGAEWPAEDDSFNAGEWA